jgi:hypothetical protein
MLPSRLPEGGQETFQDAARMSDEEDYIRKHLPDATPAAVSQYRQIRAGNLPEGFDPANAEDWFAAILRITAGLERPAAVPDQPPAVDLCGPPADRLRLPRASAKAEMDTVRDWMSAGHSHCAAVFFVPEDGPPAV